MKAIKTCCQDVWWEPRKTHCGVEGRVAHRSERKPETNVAAEGAALASHQNRGTSRVQIVLCMRMQLRSIFLFSYFPHPFEGYFTRQQIWTAVHCKLCQKPPGLWHLRVIPRHLRPNDRGMSVPMIGS
ncbi:unnamed protein product [Sphenostylis stenocarpa]|uniref:Uncharacterized protein n=1 Tax=Sphenostylis stenocarpa TaxID=92480 RepID=A0AA86RXA9_9FABA|nr:unnamed protein product [Sphenostylis stenocarpa]